MHALQTVNHTLVIFSMFLTDLSYSSISRRAAMFQDFFFKAMFLAVCWKISVRWVNYEKKKGRGLHLHDFLNVSD